MYELKPILRIISQRKLLAYASLYVLRNRGFEEIRESYVKIAPSAVRRRFCTLVLDCHSAACLSVHSTKIVV